MRLLRVFAAMLVLSLLMGCGQSDEDKLEQDKAVFSLVMSHQQVSPEKFPGGGYTVIEEVPFK